MIYDSRGYNYAIYLFLQYDTYNPHHRAHRKIKQKQNKKQKKQSNNNKTYIKIFAGHIIIS